MAGGDTLAIVNGTDANITGTGGVDVFVKNTVTEQSDNELTESVTDVQASKSVALLDNTPTAAGLAAIIRAILNSQGVLDLSTYVKADQVRRARAQDDMEAIFNFVFPKLVK